MAVLTGRESLHRHVLTIDWWHVILTNTRGRGSTHVELGITVHGTYKTKG